MRARVFDRCRLTLPLLFPSAGGLCFLAAYDAPLRLIAINAGALVAAIAWIVFGRITLGQLPAGRTVRVTLAAAAALALFLPLLLGPNVGGVMRWLPAGPVTLHSGPLLLPLLTVLIAREQVIGPAIAALAGAALALQSDAAALAALAAASLVLACLQRSAVYGIVAACGAMLAVITFGDGTLEPQIYTENVLAQVAERSLIQAIALAALLFTAPLWYVLTHPQPRRPEGYALNALLLGLGVMAVIAPFPFPLIGYGASPILGFGLALGMAAAGTERKIGELSI